MSSPADDDLPRVCVVVGGAGVICVGEVVVCVDAVLVSGVGGVTAAARGLSARADNALAVLIGAVDDLISEGGYTEVDPRHLTVFFWSLAHGLASLAVDRSMPPGLDELTIEDYIVGVFGMSQLFNGTG